jgi:hypothetical protein
VRVELSMSRAAWLLVLAALALVVVALVGVAVTGGSVDVNASESNTAKQLDACAVFTPSDAQAILGAAAWGTRPDGSGTCSYLSGPAVASPGSPPPTLVTISIYDGQPAPVSESYEGGSPVRDTAVRGLGGQAHWYFFGRGAAGVLEVHKGSHVVRLMVGDAPVDNQATAVAATKVILSRLP